MRSADNLKPSRPHVLTVDFARGALAISIMSYHVLYGEQIAAIERLAYYGVYAFFVISGFSLYLSYAERLATAREISTYALRRFWRIAPLYCLVCVLTLALLPTPPDALGRFLLNVTLTFGFASPGATSFVGGGWSIGIEIVFYLLAPFVIWAADGHPLRLLFVAAAGVILMQVRANEVLAGHAAMDAEVWANYTQPMAFFGYFAFGMLAAEIYKRKDAVWKGGKAWPVLAIASLLPFVFVRVDETLDLLKGWTGALLMTATLIFVTACAFVAEPKGRLRTVAQWFGALSYPVYLLHSLFYALLYPVPTPSAVRIGATVVCTLTASAWVHRFWEKPAQRFGRSLNAAAGAPSIPPVAP